MPTTNMEESRMPLSEKVAQLKALIGLPQDGFARDQSSIFVNQSIHSESDNRNRFVPLKKSNENNEPVEPVPEHLTGVLRQQDQLLVQLCEQLNQCKADMKHLRQSSISCFDANEQMFNDLKRTLAETSNSPANFNMEFDVDVDRNQKDNAAKQAPFCDMCVVNKAHAHELKRQIFLLKLDGSNTEGAYEKCKQEQIETAEKLSKSLVLAQELYERKTELDARLEQSLKTIQLMKGENQEIIDKHAAEMIQLRSEVTEINRHEMDRLHAEVSQLANEKQAIMTELTTLHSDNAELTSKNTVLDTELRQQTSDASAVNAHKSSNLKLLKLQAELCDRETALKTVHHENQSLTRRLHEIQKSYKQQCENDEALIDKLRSQLTEAQHTLRAERKMKQHDLEEKRALKEELSHLNETSQRLQTELDETRSVMEQKVSAAVQHSTLANAHTHHQLNQLVASQRVLISDLQTQCNSLTDQLEAQNKASRRELRVLQRQHDDLVDQVELLLSTGAKHNIDNEKTDDV